MGYEVGETLGQMCSMECGGERCVGRCAAWSVEGDDVLGRCAAWGERGGVGDVVAGV